MYTGGRLAPWFDSGPVARFCHDAAQTGASRFREVVKEHTPVDTGHLRDSYHLRPVIEVVDLHGRVYESGVFTEVDYGPYVEHGTGLWGPKHAKYLITPKNPDGWLHWVGKDGQDVFRKFVWHPGSPGAHMFTISAGVVEEALPELLRPRLRAFVTEVEQQNRSGSRST